VGRVKGGDQPEPSAAALEAARCRCYPAPLSEHYLFGSGSAGLGTGSSGLAVQL